MKKQSIRNEQAMLELGARLGGIIQAPAVIYLQGALGAGKTTLVRGYLRALGCREAVKSPTYTLVEPYQLGEAHYYHFDLYRMQSTDELEELGLRDYLTGDSVHLIEWPSKGGPLLPQADFVVEIMADQTGIGREVLFYANNARAQAWISAL